MSLHIEHISKRYGAKLALDDVSLHLDAGEIVGFLGPNGAGKSTLMKICTGVVCPDAGTVSVCGLPMNAENLAAKRLIGYLPEHNPLYLEMYVREYLMFASRFYAIRNRKTRIDELIERMGLAAECSKRIGQLSKGYRQRVGLAQALIHDPQVLLLDEPTTGLDPNQLLEIRALIAEIGREKTVLFSTHIMQEVQALCRRMVVVNRGKIVADGDLTEIIGGETLEEAFHRLTK